MFWSENLVVVESECGGHCFGMWWSLLRNVTSCCLEMGGVSACRTYVFATDFNEKQSVFLACRSLDDADFIKLFAVFFCYKCFSASSFFGFHAAFYL